MAKFKELVNTANDTQFNQNNLPSYVNYKKVSIEYNRLLGKVVSEAEQMYTVLEEDEDLEGLTFTSWKEGEIPYDEDSKSDTIQEWFSELASELGMETSDGEMWEASNC